MTDDDCSMLLIAIADHLLMSCYCGGSGFDVVERINEWGRIVPDHERPCRLCAVLRATVDRLRSPEPEPEPG